MKNKIFAAAFFAAAVFSVSAQAKPETPHAGTLPGIPQERLDFLVQTTAARIQAEDGSIPLHFSVLTDPETIAEFAPDVPSDAAAILISAEGTGGAFAAGRAAGHLLAAAGRRPRLTASAVPLSAADMSAGEKQTLGIPDSYSAEAVVILQPNPAGYASACTPDFRPGYRPGHRPRADYRPHTGYGPGAGSVSGRAPAFAGPGPGLHRPHTDCPYPECPYAENGFPPPPRHPPFHHPPRHHARWERTHGRGPGR